MSYNQQHNEGEQVQANQEAHEGEQMQIIAQIPEVMDGGNIKKSIPLDISHPSSRKVTVCQLKRNVSLHDAEIQHDHILYQS